MNPTTVLAGLTRESATLRQLQSYYKEELERVEFEAKMMRRQLEELQQQQQQQSMQLQSQNLHLSYRPSASFQHRHVHPLESVEIPSSDSNLRTQPPTVPLDQHDRDEQLRLLLESELAHGDDEDDEDEQH